MHLPNVPAIISQLHVFDVFGLVSNRLDLQDSLLMANVLDMKQDLNMKPNSRPSIEGTSNWITKNSGRTELRSLGAPPPRVPMTNLSVDMQTSSFSSDTNRRLQINNVNALGLGSIAQDAVHHGESIATLLTDPAVKQKLRELHVARNAHQAMTSGEDRTKG